jgi:two-component system nitrogen regulation sensor histidine kinase NtrY
MSNPKKRPPKFWLVLGGLSIVLLAAALFTLGSLRAPIQPEETSSFILLFALSAFAFLAFLVFGLVLARSLVRMAADRAGGALGSRFRTKLVLGAMGISLLPMVFLFLFSYSLMNRTLNLWFPRPLEIANEESRKLIDDMSRQLHERLADRASRAAAEYRSTDLQTILTSSGAGASSALDALWIVDADGAVSRAAPLAVRRANLGHRLCHLHGRLRSRF